MGQALLALAHASLRAHRSLVLGGESCQNSFVRRLEEACLVWRRRVSSSGEACLGERRIGGAFLRVERRVLSRGGGAFLRVERRVLKSVYGVVDVAHVWLTTLTFETARRVFKLLLKPLLRMSARMATDECL